MNRRKRVVLILSIAIAGLTALSIPVSALLIQKSSNGRVYHEASNVPQKDLGLVLGCSRYLANGRENLYFKYRIEKAVELFKKGKVKALLVSGDNSSVNYNEPLQMKEMLISLGVPEDRIFCDYAGLSTLDSIVRAKKVFSLSSFIVVSQEFHIRRAIFIGQNHNLDLIGIAARDVSDRSGFKTKLREQLAKAKTVLDIHLLERTPRHLGDRIPIRIRD